MEPGGEGAGGEDPGWAWERTAELGLSRARVHACMRACVRERACVRPSNVMTVMGTGKAQGRSRERSG